MSDEETPDVEEIKARLGEEIPVIEDVEMLKEEQESVDVISELRNLGRQFADTFRTAWESEERQKTENEIREGLKSFADELNKVVHEVRESPVAAKAREGADELKTRVESGDLGHKTKSGIATGLQRLSEELNKLAEQFTPAEKQPDEKTTSGQEETS